jgi:hypothetical protein
MKKIKVLFISFICIFCTFGCGETNRQNVDWVYLTPDKPQIKIEKAIDLSGSYEITEYDRNGNEIKFEMYDKYDNLQYSSISTYDDNQNLLTEARTNNNGIKSYKKNVYDKDGNLIKEYEGDDENSLYLCGEYKYKKGVLERIVYYEEDGSIDYIWENEYQNGLLVKETKLSNSGYVYRTHEYEYDADGRKIKMTDTLYGHGSVYYYDIQGRIIREELFNEEKEITLVFENEYGDYGITDEYMLDGDGTVTRHTKTYYDEKGQLSKTVYVNEKGKEKVSATWEYDAYGNMIHYWGVRGYETTAEYNEYGYPVFKHEVCMDSLRDAGTYDITTQFEYVYFE